MKPLTIILLFLLSLGSPVSAQTYEAPPQPRELTSQPRELQAGYITISWYPGKLKGYSQAETQQIIIEACQQWQSVSGVRFGTLAAGQPTQITLYPYTAKNPPWAMATYPATGQILYATTKKFERDWAVMAFAHEFAHVFGWGHADKKRVESMMHPNGSSVRYFDVWDATRARRQFGYSSASYHWPYSLKYVGDKIRQREPAYKEAVANYKAAKSDWEVADNEWSKWRDLRDAETDSTKRQKYNEKTRYWLDRRKRAAEARNKYHKQAAAHREKLKPLWSQWSRIKRQWDSIGGIKLPATMAMQDDGPCACFVDESDNKVMRASDDLLNAFKDLPKDTVPLMELAQ